jgi:adenylate cyclase
VQLLLGTLILTSNVLGVIAVFILAAFVVPGPNPPDVTKVAVENLILGIAYTGVFAIVAWRRGSRWVEKHTGWLHTGDPPNEGEQRRVLQIPLLLAGFQAGFWILAAGLFAAFNAIIGDRLTVQIAVTVSLGGLLTCANSYVMGELWARPLAARALANGPPARLQVPGVRARSILAWLLSCAVPVTGVMLVAAAALTRSDITTTRLAVTDLVLGGAVLTFGLQITAVAARANADPIKSLSKAVSRVSQGDLDARVPIYDGTEIGQLQAGFNQMAAGLEERERIREIFEHHVGEHVARSALDGDDPLGGELCDAGILFVDIIGSTTLASQLRPDEVVHLLNDFFAVVVEVSARHGGIVNKFEGDGALVLFGAPVRLDNPAGAALAAARDLGAELDGQATRFEAGIGVSAGQVVAGNVGAPDRYEYTVIGDPVNEAARLTDMAKGVEGRVLASWDAVRRGHPGEARHWSQGEQVSLRGRSRRTRLAHPTRRGDQGACTGSRPV